MIATIRQSIAGQYGAGLTMLRGCIEQADGACWLGLVGQFPFWHVAYHVVYYVDLYLSPDERSFRPPGFHREGYNYLGPQPWAPDMRIVVDHPFDKSAVLDYLASVRRQVSISVAAETDATLAGQSGFPWLPFNRLELHLYNIRHLQHHCGQLAAAVRQELASGVPWTGSEQP